MKMRCCCDDEDDLIIEVSALSRDERATLAVLKKQVRRWRRILKMDPLWSIDIAILPDEHMGAAAAAADIGEAEYYSCPLFIRRSMLALKKEADRTRDMRRIACHELLHAATADHQRAAVAAAPVSMRQEIMYRYEQLVVRMTAAFLALDDKATKER